MSLIEELFQLQQLLATEYRPAYIAYADNWFLLDRVSHSVV